VCDLVLVHVLLHGSVSEFSSISVALIPESEPPVVAV